MTKRDLIQEVARRFPKYSRREAETIVNTIFDGMGEALRAGSRIEIRGFGSFVVKHRRAREGRNPKTGQPVAVGEKRVPFFKAGKELKERVDAGAAPKTAPRRKPPSMPRQALAAVALPSARR